MTIIDSHAHTNAPNALGAYRASLLAHRGAHGRGGLNLSDEEVERAMVRPMKQVADAEIDVQLISPRPYTVMHWAKPEKLVRWYTEETNNLIARQVKMHPDKLRGVCSLPQTPGGDLVATGCVEELERCVKDFGFVGLQINPDPGEKGDDSTPGMGDEYWYPLYEKMCELKVPALVHSAACQLRRNPTFHLHFINEENIAIMSLLESRTFEDFPDLKIIISHGGGAIPYQMGRFISQWHGRSERFDHAVKKLYYDTCLYTKNSLEMLFEVMGPEQCLFGTEVPGAGTQPHPDTGIQMDHLVPVINSIEFLSDQDKYNIFEGNARRIFNLEGI